MKRPRLLPALLAVPPCLLAACAHRAPEGPASPPSPAAAAAPGPHRAPGAADAALAPLRAGADAVLRAQAEAYWDVFTKGDDADPAAAWKGHEDLLGDPALAAARAAVEAERGDGHRAAAYLRAWLVGERLARDLAEPVRRVAEARTAAHFRWAGHEVPVRESAALLAAEPEPGRRRALAEAAAQAARPVAPLLEARDAQLAAAARTLGYASAEALAADLRGEAPAVLGALADAVLARTDATWRALVADLARREGMEPEAVRARDLPRLVRPAAPASAFPAGKALDAGAAILAGLGLDLAAQHNLRLDAGPRPGKLPHAIALPVDPPRDVRLSAAPVSGMEALRGVLHELGAALAYAHVAPQAPLEFRRLGPGAVSGTWAILLEEVAGAPQWLEAHGLEADPARAEARSAAARRLMRTREAAARVLAALAPAGPAGAEARAALPARAYGCPVEEPDLVAWRLEPDPLLRSGEALRAELLAAQAELFLAGRAGTPAWWTSPAAGAWLVRTWADGTRRTPEELSLAMGLPGLDAAALDQVVRARTGL
ncbi:hypothetical protein [Anaeromyxobacter dehalogenans]|uniref:Lipoprotein n=1 Tax=Anaeromyxobacter dehalogenans (strain 2CP-C) TaxID=290397 RepID=Q2IFY5_ANADE|nr:hypothetical protein [Anaeromyxobacter dehalogenans]ABC83493.1 hypothetical protein Adeh_3727 [Anaeromyxobacter dehalogenans 2CP-C]